MGLFDQHAQAASEASQMRGDGLPDAMIHSELSKKGYTPDQVNSAISQINPSVQGADLPPPGGMAPMDAGMPPPGMAAAAPGPASAGVNPDALYDRMEEIAENLIDEKWDELVAEVKKIVEWKRSVEEKQTKLQLELEKLKENFQTLHQGVLGKLEDYDTRMQDVGTELKAVGKVFKDVIPEFVENVKELKSITKRK